MRKLESVTENHSSMRPIADAVGLVVFVAAGSLECRSAGSEPDGRLCGFSFAGLPGWSAAGAGRGAGFVEYGPQRIDGQGDLVFCEPAEAEQEPAVGGPGQVQR